jgi:hypothetical protein
MTQTLYAHMNKKRKKERNKTKIQNTGEDAKGKKKNIYSC